MKLTAAGLKALLVENIIELRVNRRRPKVNRPPVRRILCTNNAALLNSMSGRIALNFSPPTQPPKYNPDLYNLVFAWDIMMCEYRAINVDSYDVLAVMPLKTDDDVLDFWKYFNNYLQNMTPQEKLAYNDS